MPTHNDETLHDRYAREHADHLARLAKLKPEQIAEMELSLHNALAEIDRLRAKLPSQGGEAVAIVCGSQVQWLPGAGRVPDRSKLYTHPGDQMAEGVVVSRELHLRSLSMLSNYVSTLAGIDFPDNDEGDYRQRINESERARVNSAIKELRQLLAKSEGVKK